MKWVKNVIWCREEFGLAPAFQGLKGLFMALRPKGYRKRLDERS